MSFHCNSRSLKPSGKLLKSMGCSRMFFLLYTPENYGILEPENDPLNQEIPFGNYISCSDFHVEFLECAIDLVILRFPLLNHDVPLNQTFLGTKKLTKRRAVLRWWPTPCSVGGSSLWISTIPLAMPGNACAGCSPVMVWLD